MQVIPKIFLPKPKIFKENINDLGDFHESDFTEIRYLNSKRSNNSAENDQLSSETRAIQKLNSKLSSICCIVLEKDETINKKDENIKTLSENLTALEQTNFNLERQIKKNNNNFEEEVLHEKYIQENLKEDLQLKQQEILNIKTL